LAEEILLAYGWPGNVRDIDNVINRARILAEGNCITVGDLPSEIIKATFPQYTAGTTSAKNGGLREQLRALEADIVLRAIDDAGGDRKLAAQKLGISLSNLYGKLAELEHH
jgi:two-component system response regulator AtoC